MSATEVFVSEAARAGYASIRPGSRVQFLVPAGRSIDRSTGRLVTDHATMTGRAVMRGPAGWVVNAGGKYGTPKVVTPESFVSVLKR